MNDRDETAADFGFAFTTKYRIPALLFGIAPATTNVHVDDSELRVRFGPWRLRTSRENIADCVETGGFSFLKTAGPAHLSLVDYGVTFATNPDRAVCIRFHDPVKAIEPLGRVLHPGATVTVANPSALISVLRSAR